MSAYHRIRKKLENYFSGPDKSIGLCATLYYEDKDIIQRYAEQWPLTPRKNGEWVEAYIIPESRENLDWYRAGIKYDNDFQKQRDPLRKEFANFLLAGAAAEERVDFVPIL